jgi:hypothetical protein
MVLLFRNDETMAGKVMDFVNLPGRAFISLKSELQGWFVVF